MSVVSSLMYAAASVALLALVLEFCCRRRLKRLRDSPHVIALNVVNNGAYPVIATYPTPPCPPNAPYPIAPYPRLMPVPVNSSGTAYFVAPYPPPVAQPPNVKHIEAPPPSYEQVMAGAAPPASQPR